MDKWKKSNPSKNESQWIHSNFLAVNYSWQSIK